MNKGKLALTLSSAAIIGGITLLSPAGIQTWQRALTGEISFLKDASLGWNAYWRELSRPYQPLDQPNYPQYDGIQGLIERGDGCEGYSETYQHLDPNPVQTARSQNTTTFSVDVDTASYSNVRRFLNDGQLPPPGAVRVEEMLNYFRYDYPEPQGEHPLSVTTAMGHCPWEPNKRLLRIGLQARSLDISPPRNLVLLVDVSGSMSDGDKLPLLRRSLLPWVDQLNENDTLSIVTYAGSSGITLPPTSGDSKRQLRRAILNLESGGSTDGASGILTAYQLAREHFEEGAVNRVIIATDGDFNVGLTSHDDLIKLIESQRASGIYLSVLGLGRGNIDDHLMEQLADHGNGNYAYLDSSDEARRVLTQQASSTFLAVADDVKVQVEFDPALVKSFRQVGYENRQMSNSEFDDDRKDAGDLGASQQVTALYELELNHGPRPFFPLGELRLRYKLPGDAESKEVATALTEGPPKSQDFQFQVAVAEMALALQGDGRASLARALESRSDLEVEEKPLRREFRSLLKRASGLRQWSSTPVPTGQT